MNLQSRSTPLSQRILECYDALTKSERRLADVLLESPDTLVLQSATAIALRAGVSKATTARFFQRLNYVNYRAAQKAARASNQDRGGVNGAKLLDAPTATAVSLGAHLDADVQNLVRTIEQLRSDEVAAAIAHLARADKLWVVGLGDNYPLAHFVRSMLIRIKADIRMIPIGGFSIPEEFASIQQTDAMIALGVGRKTRSLRSIMRSAVLNGAHVVYVTDQASRAGPEFAGTTLHCRTRGASVFDSLAAPVSVLTYLCSALALRIGSVALQRIQQIEQIHDEWGDLLPGDM
jgi:DNA-binding MurR/RpiR family transcriptional regulator